MEHRGVVITAGFDKSKSAIAIAELLRQKGIPINGFIVVSPYSWSRLQKYIKKRGWSFLLEALPRLLGSSNGKPDKTRDYIREFLDNKEITFTSIKKWASKNKADYLSVKSINDSKAVQYLEDEPPQWLVYSGGGILRENIIHSVHGRVLNAHQGPLPEIRGMNAAEWSILLNEDQEVTIHLIDKGIDTGKIITSLPFNIEPKDTIESIRDKAKIRGIEGIVEVASRTNLDEYDLRENNSNYRQCYIMSSAMKSLLGEKIKHIQREKV